MVLDEHGFVQCLNTPWRKTSGETKTYGKGVGIAALDLSSQAGLSGITSARDLAIRCEQNWIVGGRRRDPSLAPVIWTWTFCRRPN